MSTESTNIVPGSDWLQLRVALKGTVMVIGRPGVGKSSLVRYLARQLTAEGQRVGILSTDMGQAAVGVPTCLGLGLMPPWREPAALWFIGATTPIGNLLPTVVGAAQLAQHARRQQVQTLLIDTTGLVDGPIASVLKYHKARAIEVDHIVAIQHGSELEPLLALLQTTCRAIQRLRPVAQARDRSATERKQYRHAQIWTHLQGGAVLEFERSRILNLDWSLGSASEKALPRPGTVLGLIDHAGFCLALGLLERVRPDRLSVFTNWRDRDVVSWVQVGRVNLESVPA